MFKLNQILQLRFKKGKSALPNPNLEYRIIFKKGAVETIKRAKGWESDAEMARALGLTRAYITMLRRVKVSVTATVITRLAIQMGNIEKNWWIYYDIMPWGVEDVNHPIWNQEKYMGRIPYARHSLMAELRSKDYETETTKVKKTLDK